VVHDEPVTVMLRPPSGGLGLSFEIEPDYVAPVWPSAPGEQQIMSHIDIAVDDLEQAVSWAIEAGAWLADHQPQDGVRVMLDPAGHPFCLFSGRVQLPLTMTKSRRPSTNAARSSSKHRASSLSGVHRSGATPPLS
jgi:hypothetical protein